MTTAALTTPIIPEKKRAREEDEDKGKRRKITYDVPFQSKEEGHYHVILGLDVDHEGRFKMISYLGEGTFGKVVQVWDRTKREFGAMKIVRNIAKYTRDAEYEIRYMTRINRADPEDEHRVVRLKETFLNDKGHMCMLMSRHGPNLLKCLQARGQPFTLSQVADVGYQLCHTLDFFHRTLKIIHTDLKPENLLLESAETYAAAIQVGVEAPFAIRICDFGGCNDDNKPEGRTSIIQTRHYRAPEVVLKKGWRASADMWSVGCILYELAGGKLLYDTHDNLEHLAMMQCHLGPIPVEMTKNLSDEAAGWFTRTGRLVYPTPTTPSKSLEVTAKQKLIKTMITQIYATPQSPTSPTLPVLPANLNHFIDFVQKCLTYDPNKRITAQEALKHPFVVSCKGETTAPTVPAIISPAIVSSTLTSPRGATKPEK
eukprot:PhF_6_TR13702/c0_g1_i2/m.22125/K08287/E2.7.12.1; dual-specificity kinase